MDDDGARMLGRHRPWLTTSAADGRAWVRLLAAVVVVLSTACAEPGVDPASGSGDRRVGAAVTDDPGAGGGALDPAWTVTRVIDGDTIDVVHTDGTMERVRVIGIDAPERGRCGSDRATAMMADLVDGREVVLSPGARDDRDAYERLLRYVDVGGTDAGLVLIEQGLAIARYDSRDGYGEHPREAMYVAADDGTSTVSCE